MTIPWPTWGRTNFDLKQIVLLFEMQFKRLKLVFFKTTVNYSDSASLYILCFCNLLIKISIVARLMVIRYCYEFVADDCVK